MPAKMQDVARLAGVSTATVSRVINNPDLVSGETYNRVMAAIEELDYKLNLAARNLRTNQTRTIAVLLPSIAEPVINTIVEAIEDAAIEADYTLLLCSTRGDIDREEAHIRLLTNHAAVDGVLVVSPRSAPTQIQRLVQGEVPLVMCNYRMDNTHAPSLMVDHVSSLYQTTDHLLELGHRRIALLNLAGPHYYPARMRREGFERAFITHGAQPDPSLIIEIARPTYENTDWRADISRLLDRAAPPTAIVAFNDEVALQVYAVCRERNLRIPEDLSVTGCDDIMTSRYVEPPLTTVRVPAAEQGHQAMTLLLEWMQNPDQPVPPPEVLPVELIVRESCAPPGGN